VVNTQPGWLLEANGILHPRGSEYQTQYVVDGLPMTENRSPAFAPEFGADDVRAMAVMTGGYPAEYGRKLGGVIEVVTARPPRRGFGGSMVLSAGSFTTADGDGQLQYGWSGGSIAGTVAGSTTGPFHFGSSRTFRRRTASARFCVRAERVSWFRTSGFSRKPVSVRTG
jgi:outer membrane receptor protein involved in Fe transport